ncbi:phospholipid transfer protein isoform X2 [Pagrus major]|uniref:phospholipid transfer protein isoform X2 n=1 Tax=Pagrus major TaxID=143350 RepID=UPI003CC8BCE5
MLAVLLREENPQELGRAFKLLASRQERISSLDNLHSLNHTCNQSHSHTLSYDTGNINASAEGVNINTVLNLIRDDDGRLKINNITCDAKINRMKAQFSGTLGRVYDFLASFLTSGMRFLLNQRICPALNHAALVHVNSMLETIPVRTEVDKYIGIDYSLIDDPVVTSRSLDMNFRGMFFDLSHQNDTLVNYAVDPVIREYDRMVYLALSEFFFDSGMFSYYTAGIFQMDIVNEKMPKDLEMLLRTTYFGAIMMLNPALVEAPLSLQLAVNSPPKTSIKTSGATVVMTAIVKVMVLPPGQPPVQLSSMTMETKFNAKVSMKGKRLAVHADLRRFKIFSNQSALESLALIPLQAPLKTMLQMSVVPLINNWTKRGVQIPLADGMDFIEEVVEYHNGFIVIGANLHFSKGLREMIAGNIETEPETNTV